jgi:hypothetical protein
MASTQKNQSYDFFEEAGWGCLKKTQLFQSLLAKNGGYLYCSLYCTSVFINNTYQSEQNVSVDIYTKVN